MGLRRAAVGRLPLAAPEHQPRAHGAVGLPDARRLARLPLARVHRRYFADYVEHAGVRDRIRYGASVTRAERGDHGGWTVTAADGFEGRFDALVVASGHNWEPRWPDPPYPGEFAGVQLHAHDYREPDVFQGRRVVVVGMGNRAMDIAVERPRSPTGCCCPPARAPGSCPSTCSASPPTRPPRPRWRGCRGSCASRSPTRCCGWRWAGPRRYGLPAPAGRLPALHPTISDSVLSRLTHGEIEVRPGIDSIDGDGVVFSDGRATRST